MHNNDRNTMLTRRYEKFLMAGYIPPPQLVFEDVSYEIKHMLSYEDRGSCSSFKKFYLFNDLDVHLNIIIGSQRAT